MASEHHLDQYLGEHIGEATREEVLTALRGHEYGTVIIELEMPGHYEPALRIQGALIGAENIEEPVQFLVDGDGHLMCNYHVNPDLREAVGATRVPRTPTAELLHLPDVPIEQYLGDGGCAGYRFDLGGGIKLALVLWHDLLHVTPSGDVAPGMGISHIEITDATEDGES